MGLKIHPIAEIPENVSRSYYMYILDYYIWHEPIGNTLRNSFDKIAKFASKNDAVVILGVGGSHFHSVLLSRESINGVDPKQLLPALIITTIHPKYFLEIDNKEIRSEKPPKDNLFFIKIGNTCKTPKDDILIFPLNP